MFKQFPRHVVSAAKEALNNLSANIGSCVLPVNEEVNEEVIESDEAAAAESDSLCVTPMQEKMPSDNDSESPMTARDAKINDADGSFLDGKVMEADEAAAAEGDSESGSPAASGQRPAKLPPPAPGAPREIRNSCRDIGELPPLSVLTPPAPPPPPPRAVTDGAAVNSPKEKIPSDSESDSPMNHPADKIDDSQGGLSDGKNPDWPLRDEGNSGSAAGAAEQSSGSAASGDRRNRDRRQPAVQLVPVSQLQSWEDAPEPLRSFFQAMRESMRETYGYTSDSD